MVPVPGLVEPLGEAPEAPPRGTAWPPWADVSLVAAAFAGLALFTWAGWPDVMMDFGRELYVAWRVSEGDVLYRDIVSFYGPLSPYVNALWFRAFGVGLRTLALANMALVAAVTAALWAIVRRGSADGRWAATTAALAFLIVSAFPQRVSSGSFNFIAPYSHEATHAFVLAAFAVLCALRLFETGRVRWAALAGGLVGAAFLTKPEGFVAGAGASAALLGLALVRPGHRPRASRVCAAYVGAALVPPAIAFALLATALPARQAFGGLLGSWAYLGNRDLLGLRYFAWNAGTTDIPGHLLLIAGAGAVQAAMCAAAAALAWATRGRPRLARPLAFAAVAAVVAGFLATFRTEAWTPVARTLSLWALLATVACAWMLWRSRHDEEAFVRHGARFGLAVFALLFLARIVFHTRVYHYGFVLAAPAVLVVVAAVVDWIPAALERKGASGWVFRAAALAVLALTLGMHLQTTLGWMRAKRWTVGEGMDRMRTDVRGAYINAAMDGLRKTARPGDRLVVLPEGIMINYLLRARSSVPYVTMLPTDVATFGEEALLSALQRDPPEMILLVHRETIEYGPRFLGTDYGLQVSTWIARHYGRVGNVGDPPLRAGSNYGMVALRRRDLAPALSP